MQWLCFRGRSNKFTQLSDSCATAHVQGAVNEPHRCMNVSLLTILSFDKSSRQAAGFFAHVAVGIGGHDNPADVLAHLHAQYQKQHRAEYIRETESPKELHTPLHVRFNSLYMLQQ